MRRSIRVVVVAICCIPSVAQQRAPAKCATAELPDAPSARSADAGRTNGAESRVSPAPELRADSPYEPLSDDQKFNRFLQHTISPFTFASAAMNATWLQINGDPYSYGGGVNGWMKRFGVNMVGTEARSFFSQYFFPVLLDQDPRYIPKRKGNIFARGWYAGTRVLVGRSDSGRAVFNSSYLFSVAASGALSNAYAPPDRRNFETNMLRIVGAYGSDAGGLVLEEFWPDIMRLFRRHAPQRLKDLQKKIPNEIMGMPEESNSGESETKPPSVENCNPDAPCEK